MVLLVVVLGCFYPIKALDYFRNSSHLIYTGTQVPIQARHNLPFSLHQPLLLITNPELPRTLSGSSCCHKHTLLYFCWCSLVTRKALTALARILVLIIIFLSFQTSTNSQSLPGQRSSELPQLYILRSLMTICDSLLADWSLESLYHCADWRLLESTDVSCLSTSSTGLSTGLSRSRCAISVC